jgi:hypothetical protein
MSLFYLGRDNVEDFRFVGRSGSEGGWLQVAIWRANVVREIGGFVGHDFL